MDIIYFDTDFIKSDELLIPSSNRSFKYGDGLFESILVTDALPAFIAYHIHRLFEGMHILEINIPENWDTDYFKNIITRLAQKNKYENARVRLTVWRKGEGHYTPVQNNAGLLIELFPHDKQIYALSSEGITVGVYTKLQKPVNFLASVKTANALWCILAAKYASEKNYDDVILLNTKGTVADTVSSNIFIVKNNILYTTKKNNGGVHGVMQKIICEIANNCKIELQRMDISVEDILHADEFFLTNAIHGIKRVKKFMDVNYMSHTNKRESIILKIHLNLLKTLRSIHNK